ncbi:putative nucleic acid-binding Zn-ribbon protein [Peribacillus deserti]|uniref:Nucleic acid-binding Zn-ribbon protein n=1 Tax=Peribacillus deserti TaxID=673318 RepID=A0ABS2QE75_9BACI|nr:hypothetical protein [Peribacillus deserti]MBM7691392.1 putative nucleic acid-binding Zn-ribbon protein [Peribacillus deserti]
MDKYPYHKDKQQAFQAAQQGVEQARDEASGVDYRSADFGTQVKALKQEVNEAFQQIENALEVASEHQRIQLKQYQEELHQIMKEIEEME